MATYNAKTLTITNNGDNYIIDPLQGNDVAYRDITVDIDATDWELSNDVYSYVWTNSYLTQNSQVQVYFKANVRGGLTGDLRVQKTTGQITFSTGEEPTDDISLLVRIIDANTTGILPINADMVETDAIVGETDVQGALEDLDERVRENSNDISDVSHGLNGYYIGSFDSMTALKTALIALATAHCPSAIGSNDPQTIVNFSFYPNFTDTTAGFYPVGYGERIGTMYIRYADIFSCIITFRDGSITKMAYDGTWKVDKLASESVLGDPSSASAVTGSDAFSKINSLNSNITTEINKIDNRLYGMTVFRSQTAETTSAIFKNLPIGYRYSALFIGNGNGTAQFAFCALCSGGTATQTDCNINPSTYTISQSDNGNGTMNVTIGDVPSWGFYRLITFA